jgi:hypothetical protein
MGDEPADALACLDSHSPRTAVNRSTGEAVLEWSSGVQDRRSLRTSDLEVAELGRPRPTLAFTEITGQALPNEVRQFSIEELRQHPLTSNEKRKSRFDDETVLLLIGYPTPHRRVVEDIHVSWGMEELSAMQSKSKMEVVFLRRRE